MKTNLFYFLKLIKTIGDSNRDSNRLRISPDIFNIYTQFSIPSTKESSFPDF